MSRLSAAKTLLGTGVLLLAVLAVSATETANSASTNADGSSAAKAQPDGKHSNAAEKPAEASQAPEPEVTLAAATDSDDGHSAKKSPAAAPKVPEKADEATSNKADDGDALAEKQKQLDAAEKAEDGSQKAAGAQPAIPEPPPLSSKAAAAEDTKTDAEAEEPRHDDVAPATEDEAPASPKAPAPPKKEVQADDNPIDENTYRYVEPQMSKEMRIFQLSLYAVVGCIVLTLAHKGLDAAGLDQAFFLKFIDGPSKTHFVLRGVVRVVALLSWAVAAVVLYGFTCITNRCGRRERAAAPLVPQPAPTVGTYSASSASKPKKGLGGGGAIKPAAASQGGWNDTWSDEDTGRK